MAAAKIEPGNVRRIVRALEVPAITGAPFSTFAERVGAIRPRSGSASPGVAHAARGRSPADRATASRRCSPPGWLEEVAGLVERGFGGWLTSTQAIGYAELARHLDGRLSLEEAWEATVRRTKNLARRQMAWFRRDPRIRWFDAGEARGAWTSSTTSRTYLREWR